MDRSQVSAERKQLIVKSNDIIQKSRYKLSTQQQKLILYMISKIRPNDTEFKEYIFDLKDLCQIMNIDIKGSNYYNFRESIQKIADTSFWINADGNKDKLYRWLDDVEIEPNATKIKIKFDEDLKPFLLQLKERFTEYHLESIICFDSKYSFRLYELFKSYSFQQKFIILSLDELKKQLMIDDKYDRFSMFRVNVLDKAIEEINKYTELRIEYKTIRTNRAITHLQFDIFESLSNSFMNKDNIKNKLNKEYKEYKQAEFDINEYIENQKKRKENE